MTSLGGTRWYWRVISATRAMPKMTTTPTTIKIPAPSTLCLLSVSTAVCNHTTAEAFSTLALALLLDVQRSIAHINDFDVIAPAEWTVGHVSDRIFADIRGFDHGLASRAGRRVNRHARAYANQVVNSMTLGRLLAHDVGKHRHDDPPDDEAENDRRA